MHDWRPPLRICISSTTAFLRFKVTTWTSLSNISIIIFILLAYFVTGFILDDLPNATPDGQYRAAAALNLYLQYEMNNAVAYTATISLVFFLIMFSGWFKHFVINYVQIKWCLNLYNCATALPVLQLYIFKTCKCISGNNKWSLPFMLPVKGVTTTPQVLSHATQSI